MTRDRVALIPCRWCGHDDPAALRLQDRDVMCIDWEACDRRAIDWDAS